MPASPVLPDDYPLNHARASVRMGCTIEGHLLSAGEHVVVKRWMALVDHAAHLYARLFQRRVHPIRLDQVKTPGIPDLNAAVRDLVRSGFADTDGMIPPQLRITRLKVAELRTHCVAHGLKKSGSRDALSARVASIEGLALPQMLRLRHRSLFRRIHRASLQNHDGDLTAVILEQLGLRLPVIYTVTPGIGRFSNRQSLRAYEQSLNATSVEVSPEDALAQADTALVNLAAQKPPCAHKFRFSAFRQWLGVARRALRVAERHQLADDVARRYQTLLAISPDPAIAVRLALTLERSGREGEGIDVCLAHASSRPQAQACRRTGRRLAKKIEQEWVGGSPMSWTPDLRLALPWTRTNGGWNTQGMGRVGVEQAVVQWLYQRGRTAIHGENILWTTLFGLLYHTALFAPVDGMLPSPHLSRPMDLGTPEFGIRRSHIIAKINALILDGQACTLVETAWHDRLGQHIAGVSWSKWSLYLLVAVVKSFSAGGLLAIMKPFIQSWNSAQRGLPDLVVLPGPAVRDGNFQIGSHTVMAELKGPGDTTRDHQVWWLQTLRTAGISAQLWRVSQGGGKPEAKESP